MMRCAMCLLLAGVAHGLDDDGCLAQASLRLHDGPQQTEYSGPFVNAILEVQGQHERELKDAKYGEQMMLLMRDVLGREFSVQFRRSTPLRILMGSVCKRLGLE
eukprot:CAMPEP_0179079404 /NCGR_PEP_ID=MMETSP0796-20121207/35625_1 /TAXON_ID=73915 /ORGANISM="Pyrodinium bahamense, Strain pbaha01" /LENGTH=103 /DNA_ID=CAMNT_0020776739 /DNA_START=74 /DNA_END=382 /DNA_ORIENTATION=+